MDMRNILSNQPVESHAYSAGLTGALIVKK